MRKKATPLAGCFLAASRALSARAREPEPAFLGNDSCPATIRGEFAQDVRRDSSHAKGRSTPPRRAPGSAAPFGVLP